MDTRAEKRFGLRVSRAAGTEGKWHWNPGTEVKV